MPALPIRSRSYSRSFRTPDRECHEWLDLQNRHSPRRVDADPRGTRAALALVGRSGLDAARLRPLPAIDEKAWRTLTTEISKQRLAGLLTLAAGQGHLPTAPAEQTAAADLDAAWQKHVLVMEELLLRVLEALEIEEVDVRVFKGPALAHTVYDDPAHRVFGDIDLLVPGSQLADARRALVSELDGIDALPEVRPGFDAEFAKDVLIRVEGHEVDLHRSLAAGPYGLRIPVGELFEDPASFDLGGRNVQTLGAIPTLLQVSYNAALGDVPPRLISLRDVAQVYLALQPDLDEVLETAERWGGTAVLAFAVHTAWTTLGLEACELSEWAAGYEPGRLDRRLLAASTSEQRSYTRSIAALAAIKGMRAKARYLHGILSPSPEYLEARGWTRRSHVERALNRMRPRRCACRCRADQLSSGEYSV